MVYFDFSNRHLVGFGLIFIFLMFLFFQGREGILYLRNNIQNCLVFYNTNIISLNTVTEGSNTGKVNYMEPAPPTPSNQPSALMSQQGFSPLSAFLVAVCRFKNTLCSTNFQAKWLNRQQSHPTHLRPQAHTAAMQILKLSLTHIVFLITKYSSLPFPMPLK